MKNILLLFFAGCSLFLRAQWLAEDFDVTENAVEFGRVQIFSELEEPVEFYRLKCIDPVYAQFPGGESALREQVAQNLRSYLSHDLYSVNGTFRFIFEIDNTGNLQKFTLDPEIKNGDVLYRDLNMMFLKMKPKWQAAMCNGTAVSSKIRLKVNFRTEFFDQ